MKTSRIFVSSIAAICLVGMSGCVTDPNTGERRVSRTAIGGVGGAGLGYLLGGLLGGGTTARIVGAGIGAAAGGYVGYRKDQQIRELRETTTGTGIDVTETPDGSGILVNLPDITFAVNSAEISPGLRQTLDGVAQSMVTYPNSLIDVMGHTDSTGSAAFNLDLSRRRADSVANFLISRGVKAARIERIGYGEDHPIADNTTEDGRSRNRRVEIRITPITEEDVRRAY